MKTSNKIPFLCMVLALLLMLAACADDRTPYEINDGENFTVSVKYDANGGFFTTNTSVIVDSYDLSAVNTNASGQGEIALIPPDHEARGNDAFAPVNNGYFLAGWYTQKQETSEGTSYSGKWDFSTDLLQLDPNGSYSSAEPVLTLYAAWVPMFRVEFLDLVTGETVGTYEFDPADGADLTVPQWSMETGELDMHKFPKRAGLTFESVYADAQGQQKLETLTHPGTVDEATGTAQNPVLQVYVSYLEGEWYHIYTAEQFLKHAKLNSSLVIHEDLDFTDQIWPTALMYGGYTGTIQGNGHTLSNISLTQTNNSKANAGLFGRLAETAVIKDLTFENVTFTIQSGTRVAGTSYGLLAGAIADSAELSGVQITSGVIRIDSGCYFGVSDYVIGLVCGMGDPGQVDWSGIQCTATGANPEKVQITVDGNSVAATIEN